MVLKKSVVVVFIFVVFVVELFVYATNRNDSTSTDSMIHRVPTFDINKSIDFCGEGVPLYSQDILERFEREILKNAHWHSEMTILFKRTGKYFPLIEKILKEENVPNDFKYLCIIESGLSNAVSPVGASGFWQIMKTTGKEYGLVVNKEVDERYHLEKSTRVACKYFKRAYKKFNSWTLSAASYNIGISGLARRLTKQNSENYYDLLLNSETSRYVFRILAVKQILTNPEAFSFTFNESEKYKPVPCHEVTVDTTVTNFTAWAENQDINYKMLKLFNPWLRGNTLINRDSIKYVIRIPEGLVYKFSKSVLDSVLVSDTIPEQVVPAPLLAPTDSLSENE